MAFQKLMQMSRNYLKLLKVFDFVSLSWAKECGRFSKCYCIFLMVWLFALVKGEFKHVNILRQLGFLFQNLRALLLSTIVIIQLRKNFTWICWWRTLQVHRTEFLPRKHPEEHWPADAGDRRSENKN
jgi:hypothetical protein